MKIQQIKALAVVACLTVTTASFAQDKVDKQEKQEKVSQNFSKRIALLDTNNDNLLSKAEVKGSQAENRLIANWDTMDANKDGLLSATEFMQFRKESKKAKLKNKS
jgi:hypothetical protein